MRLFEMTKPVDVDLVCREEMMGGIDSYGNRSIPNETVIDLSFHLPRHGIMWFRRCDEDLHTPAGRKMMGAKC